MKNFLEIYYTDVYKTGHKPMLPQGSTLMNSNMTPRSGKHANFPNAEGIVAAGMQKNVRLMHDDWQKNFFDRPIEDIDQFGKDLTAMLMLSTPVDVSHFKELHKLGYLPIQFKAIEEGNLIPYKIPMYTIQNTQPLDGPVFDWIVNYLETILSAESWQLPTSATISREFRKLSIEWITKTDKENLWFVDYQNHDFSMRGMGGKSAIINSGLGFAMGSRGSDTLPVIPATREFYDYPLDSVPVNSVIASEHAIMCSLTGFFLKKKDGSWENVGELEIETFRYLLKTFPTGILSLVSDTWDLWRVITEYCRVLKDEIMARDGKLVIRPDSGDPVDIICGINSITNTNMIDNSEDGVYIINGTKYEWSASAWSELLEEYGEYCWEKFHDIMADPKEFCDWSGNVLKEVAGGNAPEQKGVIELLWDIFGGDVSTTGYKRLDSHIGAIYGDSINLARAVSMYTRLEAKGFASTNIVLGIGSYTLQMVTRDTHGFAQKATYIELGEDCGVEIFKDPITDDGTKKSAKGLLRVDLVDGQYILKDQCTKEEESGGMLQIIYENGIFYNETTFEEIRERLNASI